MCAAIVLPVLVVLFGSPSSSEEPAPIPSPLELDLYRAARAGDVEKARTAIAAGAQVDLRGPGESTPLMLAARFGHVALISLLIDHGAALEARNTSDETPLWAAVRGRQQEAFDLLVAKGANVKAPGRGGDPILPVAAELGALGIVKRLIELGESVDAATRNTTWPGYTALMRAVQQDNREMVDLLLAHGADARARNATGQGLVWLAAGWPRPVLLRFLLEEKRLPVDEPDNFGRTPLMSAAMGNDPQVVRYLLGRGADPRLKDIRGQTALQIARSVNKADVAAILEEWEKTRGLPEPRR